MLLMGSAAGAAEEPASGTEWWYVLRARANMKIGNYRAAIESYEKAAELNPDNREALKQLGVANEKQGLTTKAIEAYDRYLARFDDDPDVAFKQADFLGWERYAYRRADAIRYYRMGLAKREDLTRRHALARLLAQDRGQLKEALAEYRRLLAAKPGETTWRAEYRDLLIWDPSHLDEAIREYRNFEKERPGDLDVQKKLAEMIARRDPRSDEAAQRYAALVARRPEDAALRLQYAEVLGADPRKRERAIDAYREAVGRRPDPAVRETFADLLSSSEAHRSEAVMQYRVLLRERPEDLGVRLKLARLIGAKKEDARAAIAEYDAVLARDPENAEAHRGLSQAYAWIGDRDSALHHSNLAVRYGARERETAALRGDLLRGRERRAGPLVRGFFQEGGSKTELRGVVLAAKGRGDVTPFLTLELEAGFEDYFRSADIDEAGVSGQNQAAGFFELDAEYRFDPEHRVEIGLGYHALTQSARDVVGRAAWVSEGGRFDWRVGYERKLRFDSFTALVGEEVAFDDGGDVVRREIGAARENRFAGRVARPDRPGQRVSAFVEPYVGWVDAYEIGANPFLGVQGEVATEIADLGIATVSPFYRANVYHYRDDAFGLNPSAEDPRSGAYFSPQLFVEQVPGLRLEGGWAGRHELVVEGGPAAQFVDEGGRGIRFELGGHARLAYVLRLRESLFWSFDASFTRIGDAYTRGEATTNLTFTF
ncbi:MAG: tetratricopeptide repeat protein [Myxococcota bacterium]